ncbi:hypothetical protein N7478_000630 [Penicillium angulare]|uniref:uncharacterized protein n=1 Tax=Penicillium angulare TaxID=116970 RepID=UPI00253FB6C2|nr:uncharacterized protein N7478_000630 [Penicillium angulare]KAJ5291379.1 hypothetical protein N7478_000630 [Penicillium angulare]
MRATDTKRTLPIRASAPIPDDEDSDPTSSSGSSSDSSSEDDSSDDEQENIHHENQATSSSNTSSIPNLSGRPKPRIRKMEGNSELLSRLSAFLPKMKSANEDLEKEIAAGRGKDVVLDEVEDNKDYIEMNLGLGVLEEKRDNEDSSEDQDNKDKTTDDSDILEKLMGGKDLDADKPSIEELGH